MNKHILLEHMNNDLSTLLNLQTESYDKNRLGQIIQLRKEIIQMKNEISKGITAQNIAQKMINTITILFLLVSSVSAQAIFSGKKINQLNTLNKTQYNGTWMTILGNPFTGTLYELPLDSLNVTINYTDTSTVLNSRLAIMPQYTIKGNPTVGNAHPVDINVSGMRTLLGLSTVAITGIYSDLIGEPAQVNLIAGSGISISGTYPNLTLIADGSDTVSMSNRVNSKEPIITAGTTSQYWRGDKTWQTLNAGSVGLANVTNDLQLKAASNLSDVSNVVASRTNLGSTAIGVSMFTLNNPSAVTFPRFNADNTITARTAAEFLSDIGAGTGSGTLTDVTATDNTGQTWTITGTAVKNLSLALTKSAVGLANVDNTSDANKPISTATQTALNLKLNSIDTIALSNRIDLKEPIIVVGTTSQFWRGDKTWQTVPIIDTTALSNRIDLRMKYTDTISLSNRIDGINSALWGNITGTLSNQTDLQNALDLKANLASPTFTGTVVLPSTTSIGTVSNTEISYLDNVTSAIQTQLNGKQATITTGTTAQYFRGDLSLATFPTTTASFSSSTDKNFVTDAQLVVIGNTTGTNTGDNAVNSLYSGLVSNATHTGDATGATALTVVGINGTILSSLATGILKNTTTTGVPSIAVAADFPTLNQNTTGSAATLTTSRNIQGVAFNGSAAIDIINGTGFVKSTGTTLSYDNSTYLTTASAASTYQPLDADLTTISGLTATTDNFIVSVASAWASRTPAQVKTTLSLNSVENTALSTWAGTSNITTLGTIATGTWNGTIIASTYGGTGNGFTKFTGPATTEKTFTLPNVSSTILTSNDLVTVPQGGTGLASATAYAVLTGGTTSTGAFQSVSGLGTSGYVLTSNGAAAMPTWQAASGSGETNTGSNLGGGLANYSTKVASDLQFNSFNSSHFDLASNLISIDAQKVLDWDSAYVRTTPYIVTGDTLGVIFNRKNGTNDTLAFNLGGTSSTGGAGHTIRDEGSDLAARTGLNFIGAGIAATDDSGGDETEITLDADLNTIAGLTATTDNFLVSVSSAWASRTPTQVRTTLALTIGTDVQAWDADLDAWAAKTTYAGSLAITTAKSVSITGSLTFAGTDGTTMTFPTTNATIARTDAANTFTGASTASAWVLTSPTITTSLVATTDDGAALGDATHNFSDLFLASGAVINFANSNVVMTHSSGILTIGTGELRITTVGTNTASVVTVGGSATLTNKTLTSPVISTITNTGTLTLPTVTGTLSQKTISTITSNATWTPAGDASINYYDISAQAVAATAISAPSGTPSNGNELIIRVVDNGAAKAISGWNAIYVAGTNLSLPITTTLGKYMYIKFIYNTMNAINKWQLVSVIDGL